MRKFALLVLVVVFGWSSGAKAVPAITNGLVAGYGFTGNTNDISGNGNHGVTNGATLTADRFGNPDGAYSFEAPLARIELSPIFASEQLQHTYVAWVKTDLNFGGMIYGEYVSSGAARNTFYHAPYQNGRTIINNFPASGAVNREVFFNQAQPVSTWMQVAVVRDGNTVFAYMNGVLFGSDTETASYTGATPTLAAIGNRYNSVDGGWYVNGDTYKWDGAIDELLIYNRALSPAEVQTLYSPVPEPSTALLLGIGMMGLGMRRRQRTRRGC